MHDIKYVFAQNDAINQILFFSENHNIFDILNKIVSPIINQHWLYNYVHACMHGLDQTNPHLKHASKN